MKGVLIFLSGTLLFLWGWIMVEYFKKDNELDHIRALKQNSKEIISKVQETQAQPCNQRDLNEICDSLTLALQTEKNNILYQLVETEGQPSVLTICTITQNDKSYLSGCVSSKLAPE